MIIYQVKTPGVSKGFKQTYRRNIEVEQINLLDTPEINYENLHETRAIKVTKRFLHEYKRRNWNVSEIYNRDLLYPLKIRNSLVLNNLDRNIKVMYFRDLELAKLQKLILIEGLHKTIKDGLDELHTKATKNIPDVSDLLKELKDKYPEYLL